jgi:hypothetical protein
MFVRSDPGAMRRKLRVMRPRFVPGAVADTALSCTIVVTQSASRAAAIGLSPCRYAGNTPYKGGRNKRRSYGLGTHDDIPLFSCNRLCDRVTAIKEPVSSISIHKIFNKN